MKKFFFIGAGILIFIIIVMLNLKTGKKVKGVEIEVIKKGKITESVKVDGILMAKKQVEISSEVIGKIKKIFFQKGDFVKKGELLCIIEPSEYKAQRDRIKVMLEQDLYELSLAKKNYEREKTLFEKGLISQKEFEQAEANYKRVLFKVKQDSFNLKEAEERLSKCYISSPIDGEIMEIYKKEGETVIPGTINNPASQIMIIADRSKMLVKCDVDEIEIPKIKKGLKVKIKIGAFPDTVFEGKVVRIGGIKSQSMAQTIETTPTFPVEIEIEGNNSLLLPGMSASCEIITASKENTLTLPYSAIGKEKKEEKEKFYVYIYKKGKAKKRYVKLGIKGLVRIEIKEGLSENDTVITGPEDILKKLKEGDKVKIKKKQERKKKK